MMPNPIAGDSVPGVNLRIVHGDTFAIPRLVSSTTFARSDAVIPVCTRSIPP